jgi:hypothetical protein
MQHRFRTICWILSFVLFFGCWSGCRTAIENPQARLANAQVDVRTQTSTLSTTLDFRRFAGTWTAHGSLLSISPTGMATFTARAYRWCASGGAHPCDTMNAQGRIYDGKREHLQFLRVSGPRAYGKVLSSTFHPAGLAVSLTLETGDTLLYSAYTPIAFLCGPNAPAGTCGA